MGIEQKKPRLARPDRYVSPGERRLSPARGGRPRASGECLILGGFVYSRLTSRDILVAVVGFLLFVAALLRWESPDEEVVTGCVAA